MTKITRMLKIFSFIFVTMFVMKPHVCPICGQEALVRTEEVIETDEIICSNEYYVHARRGVLQIIVHTRLSIQEEPQIIIVAA